MNYNLTTVQNAFLGLIKFKRDYNSLFDNLDTDLVGNSDSGKYFNVGVNSLITLSNINALLPIDADITISTYSASVTYGIGEYVSYSGAYYRCILASLNHIPTNVTYWSPTTKFSILIRQKLNGVYETVLGKSMLADKLFDHIRAYRITNDDDTIANAGNFVGFEIRPRNGDHLKIVLNRIGSQFSANVASLNLYLYNQNTLVATIPIASLVAGDFKFTDITDQSMLGNGRWFLFYNQDDLGDASAYNWVMDSPSEFVDILPFEVPNTTTDFVNDVAAYSMNTYGLGLDMSVYADLTNFILDNIQAFAEAIHLQWQYEILEMMLLNPNAQLTNLQRLIDSKDLHDILLGELKGDHRQGLGTRLENAYKNLRKSFAMGTASLPGENDSTITYQSE